MLNMLGILTARVMIDRDAPNDEVWVTLSTDYVRAGIAYTQSLKSWPAALRPLICYFLPPYKTVQKQLSIGRGILLRTIENFDRRERESVPESQPTSVLYAMSRKDRSRTAASINMHLKEQLNLAVGGIHTTSAVLTQTLFELAAHPEYIPPLRLEILETLERFDGVLNKTALWEMQKLDSVIREAHRLNSPNLSKCHKY